MISSVSAAHSYVPTPAKANEGLSAPSESEQHAASVQEPNNASENRALTPSNDSDETKKQRQEKQDQRESEQLSQRDREVRAHEAAHKGAAGGLGGAAHFEYQTGPDGKRYAVGGEVPIDIAKVAGDPQATLSKANRIRSAALAPVDPSAQDRAVAAQAAALAAQALKDLQQQNSPNENKPETADQSLATSNSDKHAAQSANTEAAIQQHAQQQTQASPKRIDHHAITAYQANASEQNQALHLVA